MSRYCLEPGACHNIRNCWRGCGESEVCKFAGEPPQQAAQVLLMPKELPVASDLHPPQA